jgi:hypothetical protein
MDIVGNISEAVGLWHGFAPKEVNRLVVNPEGALGVAHLNMNCRADRGLALWLIRIEYADLHGYATEPMNSSH